MTRTIRHPRRGCRGKHSKSDDGSCPHWRMEGAFYFVTFTLREGQLSVEEILLVKQHIIDSARGNCRLHALCVMPDHVHLIVEPFENESLSRLMQKVKGGSRP